jgi:hypothetical protein
MRKPKSNLKKHKWSNAFTTELDCVATSGCKSTTTKIKMVHVGKQVPLKLLNDGWIEWQAIHHGKGLWSFCLEKELPVVKTGWILPH